jgi:hypothetical protein
MTALVGRFGAYTPPNGDYPAPADCSYCGRSSDEGEQIAGRFVCQTCLDDGVCRRCGKDIADQVRNGKRVCIDCCRDIDLDGEGDEQEASAPRPIGTCPRCGARQFTEEGFCGGCHPER